MNILKRILSLKFSVLFCLGLFAVYLAVFLFYDQFRFPLVWDEKHFWETSLLFSNSLIPNLNQLRNYGALNTPLPFIIFGILEKLTGNGIFAGRLLNLALSLVMICLIAFPLTQKGRSGMLAACGLLIFPYYLWLSSHLYTDIIATFFVFLGFWLYLRNQHVWSSLAFILAIASRQYMLAFPVALAAYELVSSLKSGFQLRLRHLAPLVAAATIFGWFWLFKGLAPETAIATQNTPSIQQSTWSFSLSPSLYFLSCIGLYFVIPEWILFHRSFNLKQLLTFRNASLVLSLLPAFVFFPPLETHGLLGKIGNFLPNTLTTLGVFYLLALLVCVRFSRANLSFWLLFVNCGLMLKAYPWDKYALPLLVVFWYFKSNGILDSRFQNTANVLQKAQMTE
ncbi:MAG: hypothetical protein HC879_01615 [Leptolyngbyaceae cyanobacterium SL_5_9]|nr:hypothetical protein [Leptolyngbyaceae cyanobacterium SL_5_9]NJO73582.1 hypothetical protein [Leptolyngbyaceae cyanobacterium RM1_406_9]